jgi:acetyl-CoA C-acetyltransferase
VSASDQSSIWGKTAVVGAYEHPTRFAPHMTGFQLHAESARGALADAGLTIRDVDGFFTSGVGPIGILSLAHHLNLRPCYLDSQSIGGSSFVSHCLHAAAAIAAGLCSVALVTYGSTAASERFAIGTGGGFGSEPPDNFEAPFGPTIVGSYAMVAQRHMHEYGTTSEQLAEIAVTMRRHASLNPHAKYREPISVEDVLASRMVSPPIHKLEAPPWSDGAACLLVASVNWARRRGLDAVALTGWGEAHDHSNFLELESGLTELPWIGEAADEALARAGRDREDLDVAEIYGAFAASELLTYEQMGLFGPGEAPGAVARGETSLGGRLPINTSGGRLSLGHPPQATPLLELQEIFEQLRGEAGDRQVDGAAVGLVQAEHGVMNGSIVAILEA